MVKASPQRDRLKAFLQSADALISQGRGNTVRVELEKRLRLRVPREHALPFAALARRVNLPERALRILHPIVRPGEGVSVGTATERERAEYAANLVRVGAAEEAIELLRALDAGKIPQVLLFQAYALVSRWSYDATIPLLRRYVHAEGLSPAERAIGKVNLAAALVYVRSCEDAALLLTELLDETQALGLRRLSGNCLELSAQNAMAMKNWDEADRFLERSSEILRETGDVDEMMVRKFKAFVDIYRKGPVRRPLEGVQQIRAEAARREHWETVRDCDRVEAIARRDDGLFLHVYYGTPFESFRRQLALDYASPPRLPSEYVWSLGGDGGRALGLLCAEEGESEGLKIGQVMDRLLRALASDFYRPSRIAPLHFHLYPGEYYNPISSPTRVHQVIKRLRQWLAARRLPLLVLEKGGEYRLTAERPCALRVPAVQPVRRRFTSELAKIHTLWPRQMFSATQVSRRLSISPRQALNVLREGIAAGAVTRQGRSSAVRYRSIKG